MKLIHILVLVFQFVPFSWAGAQTQAELERAAHEAVTASLRIELPYLTKFFGLKENFSLDRERTQKILYQRFPIGKPTKNIEAELKETVVKNENIWIKFSNKSDQFLVAVRFITEKPKPYETKYTFTFQSDANGSLVELYYLKEHYSGGLSE